MVLLHATSFKYVAAGGNIGAASALTLIEGENSTVKSTGKVIDHILSTNPNPAERVVIGREFELKTVLAAAALTDFEAYFAGAEDADVYVEDQSIATLELYDVRLTVQTTTNATSRTFDLTDMNFIPEWEATFKQGDRFYMPLTLKSTNTSDLTIS
jgi:hypothetical protein